MQAGKLLVLARYSIVLSLLAVSCTQTQPPASTAKPTAAPSKTEAGAAKPAAPAASPEAKAGAPAATPKPSAEHPQYGGVLNLSHSGDPGELDPLWNPSYLTHGLVSSSFTGLVEFDPIQNDKIANRLAESWQVSDDGRVYTFRLHKDVRWHDGKPFQAADVKRTIEAWLNPPKGKLWFQKTLASMITGVETVDSHTVKVTLKQRQNSFLGWMATVYGVIAPSHVMDSEGRLKNTIIGTGPFKFKKYDQGVVYETEKNRDFFIKGWPYLDGVVSWIIRDGSTRFAAFRTGKIDVTNPFQAITATDAEFVEKQMKDASVMRMKILNGHTFAPQHTRDPWKDVRVRRAASLAFDRQAALAILVQGLGSPGTPTPPGPWSISSDELKQLPGYRQPKDADIAEAKRLLAEAGYPDGFEGKLLARVGDKSAENMAVLSSEQLRRIGIRLRLDMQEDVVWSRIRANKEYEAMVLTVAASFPEPGGALVYYGPGNDFGYESAKRDDAIRAYEIASDSSSRLEAAKRLELLLMDEVPYVVLLWENRAVAYWNRVKNVHPWVGHLNNNRWAHVWLAK